MSQQLSLPFSFGMETDFNHLFAGTQNEQLFQGLKRAVTQSNGEIFLIWSSVPSGKSHMLQACCSLADQYGYRAAYFPLKSLFETSPDVLADVDNCEVVTLDDIDQIAGERAWEEAVFHAFNQLKQKSSTLIMSTNQPPAAFTIQMPDLVSRLKSAEIYQIHELPDDEKIQALIHRAAIRGIMISPEVGQYCLSRVGRDWLTLITLLNAIDQFSINQKRRVTVPFVKNMLEEISKLPAKRSAFSSLADKVRLTAQRGSVSSSGVSRQSPSLCPAEV